MAAPLVGPMAADRHPHSARAAVPRHVAIIMDGNGRWAKARFLPRVAGHSRGVESVRAVIEASIAHGVEYLTLFAFSSENWARPAEEVSVLMRLFMSSLQKEIDGLIRNGVRLHVVGQIDTFEPKLRELIRSAQDRTAVPGDAATRLHLTICASYSGRWDIVQAAAKLAQAYRDTGVLPDEASFAQHLALSFAPDPDLLIRTSGEQRISNFLLWQLAYAESYFTEALWPDFGAEAFSRALSWYAGRERRFGRTSEQVRDPGGARC